MLRPVCPLGAIPHGEAYRWAIDPPVAIFHTDDGEVFAVDDTCTHANVSLSEGELDDHTLECWLHGSRFDIRTGDPSGPPATVPVNVYPVKVQDGEVFVGLTPLND